MTVPTAAQPLPARTLRAFGFLMGGMIAGVFGLLLPLLKSRSIPVVPWAIALLFAAVALARPAILNPLYRVWMAFGAVLGAINSRIILAIVFGLVITPLAVLFRVVRRDVLRLRPRDADAPTYRIPVAGTLSPEDMEKPF